jgi:hypothetical protein
MSRIPLVATVVGVLLVGGATTGGTFASWSNQRQLHANGVQSGQLSFTATSPGAVAVDKTAGYTADSTFVLDDTSVGKNNRQRITASVAGTPAGITARIGTSCATATTASVAVDTTPTSANQTVCVRVTSSTTAVSGNVTVNISGAQRPTGWSTPTTTVSVPITVNTPGPAAPVLSCRPRNGNTISFTWVSVSGETYTLFAATSNEEAGYAPVGAVTPPHVVSPGQNTVVFYRVKAANSQTAISELSNTIRVARDSGASTITCQEVTP